jgi:membrane protein implicated in regulation of membrane protease activity
VGTMFWIWLAAAVVFLIFELSMPTLVFACLFVGAVAGGVYGIFFPESYYWQLGIFLIVSAVLLPLTRSLAHKITKPSPQKSNIDALLGQVAVVTKAIDPQDGGQVRIEGEVWRASAGEAIESGAKVKVVSVSGTRVVVQRAL